MKMSFVLPRDDMAVGNNVINNIVYLVKKVQMPQ